MEKIFQQLLESKILTQDTIDNLKVGIEQQISEAVADKEIQVKAHLTEQWVQEKNLLVEAIDLKIQDLLESELKEFNEDIERYQHLEAEYAQKLIEAKENLNETYKNDVAELVGQIDQFLDRRIADEIQEFKTDLEQVKKNEFGMKVFETFAGLFQDKFVNEDEVHSRLAEAEEKLSAVNLQLQRTHSLMEGAQRSQKMEQMLGTINNAEKREVMATLLESIKTVDLDSAFKKYLPAVMNVKSNKEGVISEGKDTNTSDKKNTQKLSEGVLKTGDQMVESVQKSHTDNLNLAVKAQLKKLAGIDN